MGNEIIVRIEKISFGGYGIAHYAGIVVFVADVCPDELCKVVIIKKNKNYYSAKLIEIIEKSPHRIKPFCPMYNVCGACMLQYADYDYQLKIKKQITEDTLHGIDAVISAPIPSPKIKAFRHKIQYPIRETKVSKRLLIGYFKPKSHDIVNIKYCPIQPPICDKIAEYIRNEAPKYKITGYNEKKHSGLLRHLILRVASETGQVLVTAVINSKKIPERLKDFLCIFYEQFPEISGVTVNFNTERTNLIMGAKTELVTGEDYILENLCGINFKISSNTFFQVNPKSAENIFKFVKDYIKNNFVNPKLLDAYAGISAFGMVVSDICSEVISVEENICSTEAAECVKKLNKISNVSLIRSDFAKFAEEFSLKNPKYFDIAILDPPRKGCTKESLDCCLKLTKSKIIYVSCNPATLARDLKYIIEKGAIVEYIQPFDLFCHTFHIENAAIVDISGCT